MDVLVLIKCNQNINNYTNITYPDSTYLTYLIKESIVKPLYVK